MGKVTLLIFVVLSCLSCRRPVVEDMFVSSEDAGDSLYRMRVDFSDSLSGYDLSLFTRSDRFRSAELSFDVEWVSPSGDVPLRDTIHFNSNGRLGATTPYRSDVRVGEYGVWTLNIRPLSREYGISGLGLISERKDGTR